MFNKRAYILGMVLVFLVGAVAGGGILYWLQTSGRVEISSGQAQMNAFESFCRIGGEFMGGLSFSACQNRLIDSRGSDSKIKGGYCKADLVKDELICTKF